MNTSLTDLLFEALLLVKGKRTWKCHLIVNGLDGSPQPSGTLLAIILTSPHFHIGERFQAPDDSNLISQLSLDFESLDANDVCISALFLLFEHIGKIGEHYSYAPLVS